MQPHPTPPKNDARARVAGSGTVARGFVEKWDAVEGRGAIVSDETPGGCLVKRLQLMLSGYHELTAGQSVEFEYEETDEDRYQYRVMQVTVEGDDPISIPFGNSTSGLALKAFSITRCPQCGGRIVKEGGPGGLLACSKCGYEEELPPFPPQRAASTSPMRVLPFPAHEVVGTLDWAGSYSPERGPVLATGNVESPDDQKVSLDVHRVDSVEPSGDGWVIRGGTTPVDLQFLADLPSDSIDALKIGPSIVPASFRFVSHLAPGLRKLYLSHTDLSGQALDHVAKLTGLTYLQTFGNSFTDSGVQQLVALQNVENLYLEEQTLSAASLAFVRDLPHLARLGLQDMPLSDDELADLRSALPGVQVG
jgi:cold shock CspA family protein